MSFTHSTVPIPPITLTFDRYFVYELHRDVPFSFQFVICLSSTGHAPRYSTNNVSFVPLIVAGPYADHDPFRVPIQPAARGGSARLTSRLYAAIDALQTINKAAFLPTGLGRITPTEEREVRDKLADWLGLPAKVSGDRATDVAAD